MSTFFTLNGKRAVSGRITIPLYGAWVADVVLAEKDAPTGAIALVLGDLALSGTARATRAGTYGGKPSVRVVGGKDGWSKVIDSKGYAHAAGVKLSAVLQDAAAACGESVVVGADKVLGKNWCRKKGRASRVLRLATEGVWWIDEKGVTQTKARPSGDITKPFTVTDVRPGLGQYSIATETFKDWLPGRTFKAINMAAPATISSVSLTASEGKVVLLVTDSASSHERLQQEIRAIVADQVARLEHGTIVEYVITRAASMEIDAKPSAGKDSPWPPLAKIALKAGLFGETVKPTVGAKALVVFMDNDPALYRCIGVEGLSETTAFSASSDITATAGGVFKVNGGGNFVALSNLVNTNFATLVTKFNAHTHGTGVGPSTPPIVPLVGAADFPSTACSKLKAD